MVEAMLGGVIPCGDLSDSAAKLGRKGGKAKSDVKTAASRENGAKNQRSLCYRVVKQLHRMMNEAGMAQIHMGTMCDDDKEKTLRDLVNEAMKEK